MTKKHFIVLADTVRSIADELSRNREFGGNESPEYVANVIQGRLADFCASQNPRFDRGRWLAYIAGECGPNGGRKKAK